MSRVNRVLEPAKLTVCVVDGDPAVRDSLATALNMSGYPVHTFSTGQAIINAASSTQCNCVVCEAELPDTSGVSVFHALRPMDPHFALLISNNNPELVSTATRAGIDHIFFKPLVNRRLLSFIAEAGGQQR